MRTFEQWSRHHQVVKRTAAREALTLCKKFYPWRVEQAREAMRESAEIKKAQAGR